MPWIQPRNTRSTPAPKFDGENTARQLNHRLYTLMQMAQAIDENAFYPVAADTLIRFGIAGMMEILDPYSVFLEKRNLDNFNIQTQGKYGGLGFHIQVVYPDSAIAVWSLLHDQTPAALSGVKSGDLITAINNTSTKGMSAGVAADSMRGEPGTSVTLTLKRADRPTPFDLTIERQEVQMNSVSLATLFPDDTGYIKLKRFQKGSNREMFNAILELEEQGMERLIFDLRGNGGGYLEEAVQIADLFLPRDRLIVFTASRVDTIRNVLHPRGRHAARHASHHLSQSPVRFGVRDRRRCHSRLGPRASAWNYDRGQGIRPAHLRNRRPRRTQADYGRLAHAFGPFHRQAHAQGFYPRPRVRQGVQNSPARAHRPRRRRHPPQT